MKTIVMRLVPLKLEEANAFVMKHHRHHGPMQGHRFSIGAVKDGELIGAAIVGRPVGGASQNEWIEVTRCCSTGSKNVCSFLYSAAARAGKDLGYTRIQTYILADELGTSLLASGWEFDRMSHPTGWHHEGGRGARVVPDHLRGRKQLWFKRLAHPMPTWSPIETEAEFSQMHLESTHA